MPEGRNSDSPNPRRRLYGRSRGKALRPGQARLLKEALPRVAIAPEALVSGSLFPFEPRELWLEIGFGSGEHLIAQAKSNPEIGFIGCEPFLNGVAAALSGIERENLINVRIRRGDAQTLLEGAPAGVFSRVFLSRPLAEAAPLQASGRLGTDYRDARQNFEAGRRSAVRHRRRRLCRLDAAPVPGFAIFPLDGGARRRLADPLAGMASDTL
jgi:Putative methyltransferase